MWRVGRHHEAMRFGQIWIPAKEWIERHRRCGAEEVVHVRLFIKCTVRYCQLSVSTLPNPQPVCKKLLNPSIL